MQTPAVVRAENGWAVSRMCSFDSLPNSRVASSSLRPRDSLNLWQLDTVIEEPYGSWEKPSQASAFPCPGIPFAEEGGKLWCHTDSSQALCVASALGLARCPKGTAKGFTLICLQTSVQTHPPISRETIVTISSQEILHGVKCSSQITQKARPLHQAHRFCTIVVAAPGTPYQGVSWVPALPRGYRLDTASQILELDNAKASGFNKTGNWAKFGLQKFLPGTELTSYLSSIFAFPYPCIKSQIIFMWIHIQLM